MEALFLKLRKPLKKLMGFLSFRPLLNANELLFLQIFLCESHPVYDQIQGCLTSRITLFHSSGKRIEFEVGKASMELQ
jgi:hypothetical protein